MPRFLSLALVALITAGCGASQPTVAPTAATAPSNPTAAPSPAPTRVAPTPTAARQVAELELKWGPMDPNLMVNEGLGLAFQAESVPGVISARVSEEGIHVQYDAATIDAARLRTELRTAGLPIAN